MKKQLTLKNFIGSSMQVCYCGEKKTPCPPEPLTNHSFGCVMWDWGMALGMITPEQRAEQLDQYANDIGDKDGIQAEAE
jgi:hypothetical protein